MKNLKVKILLLVGTILSFALVHLLKINETDSFYFAEVVNADAGGTVTESTTIEGGGEGGASCGSGGCGSSSSNGTGTGSSESGGEGGGGGK